jgi:hypothetical protein
MNIRTSQLAIFHRVDPEVWPGTYVGDCGKARHSSSRYSGLEVVSNRSKAAESYRIVKEVGTIIEAAGNDEQSSPTYTLNNEP